MSKNRVIGKGNKLPWDMPADMKHFRDLTRGKPVIMGRKTFESIGHPLPNRKNIVITSDSTFQYEGCTVVHSIEEALHSAEETEEMMVIGGSSIYEQFLPHANRIYLTVIDQEFDGDAYFPEFDMAQWRETEREEHPADEKNSYPYTFLTFEKSAD
jgi:dihydrofolate reductase